MDRDLYTGLTAEEEDKMLAIDEDPDEETIPPTPLSPPSDLLTPAVTPALSDSVSELPGPTSVSVSTTVAVVEPELLVSVGELPVPVSRRIAAYPFAQLASAASCPGAQQAIEVPCRAHTSSQAGAESGVSTGDKRSLVVCQDSDSDPDSDYDYDYYEGPEDPTGRDGCPPTRKRRKRTCSLSTCQESAITRPRPHALVLHLPWYFAAFSACWRCRVQEGSTRNLRFRHYGLTNTHPSGPNFTEEEARLWSCLCNGLLHFIRHALGLRSLHALLAFVQDQGLYPQDCLPPGGSFSPEEQMLLEMYEQLHFPSDVGRRRPYTVEPPDCVASLLHWDVLLRLLDLLSPADQDQVAQLYHPCMTDGADMHPQFLSGRQTLEFVDSHFHLDDMITRGVCTHLAQLEAQLPESRTFCFAEGVANYIHPQSWALLPHQPAQDTRVVFTVGVHPKHSQSALNFGLQQLCHNLSRHLVRQDCVGLGEVGLDYSKERVDMDVQRQVLRAQLSLQAGQGRPLVLHCRDHPQGPPGEASIEVLGILRSMGITDRNVHIHCFSGTVETVRRWLDFYPSSRVFFGFTSQVMGRNQRHVAEAADRVPLSNLLLESDAPYLTPGHPRGVANHPWNIYHQLAFLAARRGVPIPILLALCNANARVLYNLW